MKAKILLPFVIGAGVFALALTTINRTACAQVTGSGEEWNKQYRSDYEVPLGTYTGRSPYMQGAPMAPRPAPAPKPAPAPAPKPEPAPTPAPAPKTGCSDPTWGLIRMSKVMPAEAGLGSEFTAELRVTAQACAANVVVRDYIPTGLSYVRSEPSATVEGDQLVWRLGNMDAGETKTIKVTFRADKEGTLVNCASVSADPRTCASVFVGKPALAIEKTGPQTALINSEVTYNIVVRNTGSAVARNVVVTDPVPDGFSHASGQKELSYNVGDLAPGQSKQITVTFKANKRGEICNVATANSINAGKVSDDACTVILVPGLKIEKSGTKEQILGRNADYNIVVANTGDTTLKNVIVTDTAPAPTSIVEAPGATVSGNRATWTIAELKPGEKRTLSIKLTSRTAGTHCNSVSAAAAGLSDSAEACTVWRGIAAVLLEVVDDPDPLAVGETTMYTIKVTNQGFANINNVKLDATFAEQVTPVSSPQGRVSAQTVSFPAVPTIAPKQSVTYTIQVKAVKPGDSRNRVRLMCDELTSPVVEEESTTVY